MAGTFQKSLLLQDLFAQIKTVKPMVCDMDNCSLGTQMTQLTLHTAHTRQLIKNFHPLLTLVRIEAGGKKRKAGFSCSNL